MLNRTMCNYSVQLGKKVAFTIIITFLWKTKVKDEELITST